MYHVVTAWCNAAGAPILNQLVLIVAKVTTHLGSATQVVILTLRH